MLMFGVENLKGMPWRKSVAIVLLCLPLGCVSGRSFWSYVIDEKVDKPLPQREVGEKDKPPLLTPYNVKVVYNDGQTETQVLIPVLSSGQQIVIDHQGQKRPAASALSLVPMPQTPMDRELEDRYLQEGNAVVKDAAPISIVKTHEQIRAHVIDGNFALALQYADKLLERYPNHLKTLQTKGSLLLKIGEKRAALEAYRKAQNIESDPQVEDQIRKLEQSL